MSKRNLLGKKVKDKVSGFEGIVVGRHTFLSGCDRYSVQPPVDEKGKLPEQQTFDDPQLEIVREKRVVVKGKRPGGPMSAVPKEKHIPKR